MINTQIKIIHPDTRIGVSNLIDQIEKAILSKFGNNVKDTIYDMSSEYTTEIIDKG